MQTTIRLSFIQREACANEQEITHTVSSIGDTQIRSWRICNKKRLRGVHMGSVIKSLLHSHCAIVLVENYGL